jgi:hypothetical protein
MSWSKGTDGVYTNVASAGVGDGEVIRSTVAITSSTSASPSVITTSTAHNASDGRICNVSGHTNAELNVSDKVFDSLSANTFSMGVNTTTTGTGGTLTLRGSRAAYSAGDPQPANFIQTLQCATTAHEIKHFAFGSYDGRASFEAGIEGSNAVIRKVAGGYRYTSLASAAHGITSGVPFSMDMRVEGLVVSLYLNGSSAAVVTYTIPANDSLAAQRAYGFACETPTDNEKVLLWQVAELVPSISVRENMLWIVGGGTLYVSLDGTTAREVARGVCKETGYVELVEFRQTLRLLDGQRAKTIDPVNYTVSDWTATSGSLPGYTTAGTSDMGIAVGHWGRIEGVSQADPANIFASALNDAADWDTGAENSGKAFSFVTARVNMSGQVIRGLLSASANRLIIGCGSSMWQLLGDPSRGQVNLDQRSTSVGISGPRSMALTDDDIVVFHGPMGFYQMVGGSTPQSVSSNVVSESIQYPPSERSLYTVNVVRDPNRKVVLILMTKDTGSVHFWYDENVGGYSASAGGFFPLTFPDAKRPTAALYYDGKLLLGGADGYVRFLDDASKTDDGTAIESRCYLERVDQAFGRERDVTLERLHVTMLAESDPVTVRAWKGMTPQQVYNPSTRALGYSVTKTFGAPPIAHKVRNPSVAIELYSASGRWGVEDVEIKAFDSALIMSRHNYSATATPATVSVPPGAGTGTGTGDTLGSGPGYGTGTAAGSGTGTGTGTGTSILSGGGASGYTDPAGPSDA